MPGLEFWVPGTPYVGNWNEIWGPWKELSRHVQEFLGTWKAMSFYFKGAGLSLAEHIFIFSSDRLRQAF